MHCSGREWVRSHEESRVLLAFAFTTRSTRIGGASLCCGGEGWTAEPPPRCRVLVTQAVDTQHLHFQSISNTERCLIKSLETPFAQRCHPSTLIHTSGSRCTTRSQKLPSSEQQALVQSLGMDSRQHHGWIDWASRLCIMSQQCYSRSQRELSVTQTLTPW
jgi:hypothetical protein